MSVLLYTCIVIDILRQRPEALHYLATITDATHLSVATVTELRAGQRERERMLIDTIIQKSIIHDVTLPIAEDAGAFMLRFRKSYGIDLPDARIAATALHHNLPLATLNLKHFPMFPALARPY